MDHQVQHYPNIRAARRVRRQTVDLDETWVGGDGLQVFEDRVEAFDMADLEHAVLLLGQLDQVGGLGGVVGHRLLDQHVAALLQECLGQLEVGCRRRNDAHGIAGGGGLGQRPESANAVLLRETLGRISRSIIDANELELPRGSQLRVNPDMLLAE